MRHLWFRSRSWIGVDPCTDTSPSAGVFAPGALLQISQHLFSCTLFEVPFNRTVVPATGWPRLVFVCPIHLCCVLSLVSLSPCTALSFPSSVFQSLICNMEGSALHSACGLFVGCVCVRAFPLTVCDALAGALSHNFLNEDFINTVL